MSNAFWRVEVDHQILLARGDVASGPSELLDLPGGIDDLLSTRGGLLAALEAPSSGNVSADARLLAPIDHQEVWASGVTFERSRSARNEESASGDVYDAVYSADRPELFFKSNGDRVRGPGDEVCIRSDSGSDVPEPEIGIVIDAFGEIVAYTVGNDMSSRSIEGENPLYLPQAKIYEGSCAIGPCLVPLSEAPDWDSLFVDLQIHRQGEVFFHESVPLSKMKRSPGELRDWLMRGMRFPRGVVLLGGTSIVPPLEFTLRANDEIAIDITGIGRLHNTVQVLDLPAITVQVAT